MQQHQLSSNNQANHHKFHIQTTQRQAFIEIFNMHSTSGKIKKQDLQKILYRVGYSISGEDFNEICEKIFGEKQEVNFEEFMRGFQVEDSEYDLRDIKNAFRLIAGQSDTYIPLKTVIQMFKRNDFQEEQVNHLLQLLDRYIDQKKEIFNYELFLSHLKG